MRVLKIVVVSLVTIVVVLAAIFFLMGYLKPKQGGIRVDTTPTSDVYVNGSFAGSTPFRKNLEPGQVTMRLQPPATASGQLLAYETRVNIVPGIETVMRREFGETEESSSGDVVSFEKQNEKTANLVVVSIPDNAQVSLDGVPRGFTPFRSTAVSAGTHQITVKSPNYGDRTISVNTLVGYRLTIFVKLAKSQEEVDQTQPSTLEAKTFVEILATPTGFLRVRTEPGALGEEIAEVKTGEKYLFLGEDEKTGWYKIQYSDPKPGLPNGITGWVSNDYSQIATESATPL